MHLERTIRLLNIGPVLRDRAPPGWALRGAG
jgi:hypothetical protein